MKRKKFFNSHNFNIIFILLTGILLFNCGSTPDTYEVENVGGVRYVHNLTPKWGDKPQVALEFVRQVGEGEDGEDENYIFVQPRQIGRDGSGHFYLLDGKNFRIIKFDENWRFELQFGRKGQGPGEFSMFTFDLDVDKAGNVYAWDYMSRRAVIFSASGKATGGFKWRKKRAMYFRLMNSGNIVKKDTLGSEKDKTLLTVINSKGQIQSNFGTVLPGQGEVKSKACNYAMLDVDSSDNIFVTFLNANRIEKYSPQGKLLMVVDRPLNYKIEHTMVEYENTGRYFPELTLVSHDIAVDVKGRIWNLKYSAQPKEKGSTSSRLRDHSIIDLEIFDKTGVLLGSLPTPKNVNRIRIFGDRLYLVDTYVGMCIYEYKIIDPVRTGGR